MGTRGVHASPSRPGLSAACLIRLQTAGTERSKSKISRVVLEPARECIACSRCALLPSLPIPSFSLLPSRRSRSIGAWSPRLPPLRRPLDLYRNEHLPLASNPSSASHTPKPNPPSPPSAVWRCPTSCRPCRAANLPDLVLLVSLILQ